MELRSGWFTSEQLFASFLVYAARNGKYTSGAYFTDRG